MCDKYIEPGYYDIPFDIEVPENIPPTAHAIYRDSSTEINADIKYEVRGRLSATNL